MTEQSTTTDLTAWLSACYDERERQARAATPGPWRIGNARYGAATVDGPDALQDGGRNDATGGRLHVMRPRVVVPPDVDYGPVVDVADAAHIAAHDPAWRLADVAVKRAILDTYLDQVRRAEENSAKFVEQVRAPAENVETLTGVKTHGWTLGGRVEALEHVVRLLASEFAGEPGYLTEEWKP